jgi:DNA-binding XRE family transcriptional regulator
VDKRRKKLTAEEQLDLRERVSALLEEHPDWDVPQVLREVRTSLHLTQRDMARVGKISEPTLRNIEARRHSPSIETVEAMLRPFGLKLAVVRASPNPQ